jgi:AcrR family transcriptional regulator
MKQGKDATPEGRGSNRAKLSQDRSRATRGKIVKSALALWTKRGFEEGYDATTVDEIADHAGMSRATIYYYFAKKDDILRALTWLTAEDIHELAVRSLLRQQSIEEVLDEVVREVARKVTTGDRAAVRRAMQLSMHDHDSILRDRTQGGMTRALSVIIAHAQDRGELPRHLNSVEIAEILATLCSGCITQWSAGIDIDLVPEMQRMVAFTLAGARSLPPTTETAAPTTSEREPRRSASR